MGASNVIGLDDGPFSRDADAAVLIAGPVFSGQRLDGLLTTHVQRDGLDATDRLIDMINGSRFSEHIQLIMIGGVTVGGFNVVDLNALSEGTRKPVLAIVRKRPDQDAIVRALENVPHARARLAVLEKQGPPELLDGVFIHRVGIDSKSAQEAISRSTLHGSLPEPLRIAHLLAGGIATGHSKGAA